LAVHPDNDAHEPPFSMSAAAGESSAALAPLALGRRSLFHADFCGYVVPIVVLLSPDDAAPLSARSAGVLAELLPLLSSFFNAHVSVGRAGAVDDARAETLTGATITARFELRVRATELMVSTVRAGGFGRERVTDYEIHVLVADRAAAVERTTQALKV
jgi:hypothetical protein